MTILNSRRAYLIVFFVLLYFICQIKLAQADYNVCNKDAKIANVAIGLFENNKWVTQGWYYIQPGECKVIVSGPLNKFYYIFAKDPDGVPWSGKTTMCINSRERFRIEGYEDCLARGWEQAEFFQVDTNNKADHTTNLTSSNETSKSTTIPPSNFDNKVSQQNSSKNAVNNEGFDAVGTTKQWGAVDITLTDASIRGNKARVSLLLKNTSGIVESISSLWQMNQALSDSGDKGQLEWTSTQCDGDIPPNSLMKCHLSWSFPVELKNISLTIGVVTKTFFKISK